MLGDRVPTGKPDRMAQSLAHARKISSCLRAGKRLIVGLAVALCLLLPAVLTTSIAEGAARTASVSGNWSNTTTWGGAAVPTSVDAVSINNGITVTVDTTAACASISFSAGSGSVSAVNIGGTNSLTVSGALSLSRPATGGSNTVGVNAGTLTVGSIALSGSTGTRPTVISIGTGTVNVSGNITCAGVDSQLVFSGSGTLNSGGTFMSGTAGTFTASTGTVKFNRAGSQTVAPFTYVFNNLTLSNSGSKTVNNATVNGVLSIEGAASTTGALTYGSAATLQYRTTDTHAVGIEWLTPFAATGGVIVANTAGSVTLNTAKAFNANVPLAISGGATLSTSASNWGLTFGGNFANVGTFTGGSSTITVAGNAVTQNIDGFTTSGTVSMTKTGGIATFNGNVNGGALTINGSGGTLNLGTGLTHTFTGTWTRTAGTLNGGSSILNIGGSVSGTGGTFSAGAGTVNYNRAGTQTVAAVTYNNLTLSGSGAKTTTGATVNGILSLEGTATTTGMAVTCGAAATLQYKGLALQTTGVEFPANFAGSGGVIINNSSGVNLGGSVAITSGLTLTSGTFAVGANTLTLNGPAIAGTPLNLSTTSSSSLVFGGASSGVNVPASVTALNNVTVNNANGITLNSSPTISGTLTLTSGRIVTGANTLIVGAAGSVAGGAATAYVNGNLRKAFNTGAGQAFTFTVGDASSYTPVSVASMTVGTAGSLQASTAGSEHANIATSGIDSSRDANRYWTLTAVGGLVMPTCNATFNFVSFDLDAGANTANFVVRKYLSGAWSAPPGGSSAGSSNTTGLGFTAFGDFVAGEVRTAPSVTSVALYQTDRTTAVMAMTPQVEYSVKVSVSDSYVLSELSSVAVTVYYNAGGTYNPANIPGSGNTQTAAILTCLVGGSPSWSIDAGAGTTWSIVSVSCTQPGLAGTSGDFWFNFKPGKVATAANGKWYVYARTTSTSGSGDNHQDNRTMNWYGEISVNSATVDFGSVAVGSDYSANAQTGISVTYVSNGSYSMRVKLSSPWSGSGKTLSLNASGTPGTGEFSVKANGTANLGSAVVAATSFVTIGTGTQTGESGATSTTHTLWLKVGATGMPAVNYSGTIYYGIAP